jgi:hypothetical protein
MAALGDREPWAIEGVQWLGTGSTHIAWRLGAFVVKTWRHPSLRGNPDLPRLPARRALRLSGIRVAPTVRVGEYLVQMFYPLANRTEFPAHRRVDGGEWEVGNIGRDRRGRLVAFDW